VRRGQSGFELTQLSLVGKGCHTEEEPMGDKVKGGWGGTGDFWGGIWGLLLAPAVFVLPGVGVVAMAGPFVAALVVGGLSALGAALTRIGVPADQVVKYEAALKVDKYLLLVHGSVEEQARACALLMAAPALA
jgi:hypothetical protein